MENHDHRLVTLLDLAGNTFRNEVVGAFQTDDRQLPRARASTVCSSTYSFLILLL